MSKKPRVTEMYIIFPRFANILHQVIHSEKIKVYICKDVNIHQWFWCYTESLKQEHLLNVNYDCIRIYWNYYL